MKSMQSFKHFTLKHSIFWLLQFLSARSNQTFITMALLAEKFAKKDYYQQEIRHIRRLFMTGHPSLKVVRKIMGDIHPLQRRKLIECFIINQLFVGTEKRARFSRMPNGFYPPGFMVISPSMKCNLSCYGCYSALQSREEDLSFEDFDSVLCQQKEMGMYFSVISGGEPLVYPHLFEIFRKHNDIAFLVYTNGALLDKQRVKQIAELGNVLPCVSVEGFEKETDLRRGPGHFRKVMDAFDHMRDAGLMYGFSATQTRENSDIITSDEYIDMFIDKGCILGWYFHYMPVGRAPAMDLMPLPEQRHHLRERIIYFRKTKPILLGDFHNDGPLVGGCIAAGRKYLHINSHGDIEPCVFFQFSTHNIRTSSLQEALQSPFFHAIRQGQKDNPNLLRPCTLIDKPTISRHAIATCHPCPSHNKADELVKRFTDDIDCYSEAYGKFADKAWDEMPHSRKEYLAREEEYFAKTGKLP